MNIYGNIDYTPTAGDLGYHLSKEIVGSDIDERVEGLFFEIYRLEHVDSLYSEAIKKLDEVVDFVYANDYSYQVVNSYVRLYGKLGDIEGLERKLEGLYERYGKEPIGLASYSYLVTVLSGMRRFEEAIGVCDEVVGIYERLGGHEEEIGWLLFERIGIEEEMRGVLGKGTDVYDFSSYRKLMDRYSDTEAAKLAREIYGGEIYDKEIAGNTVRELNLRAYPNPFNPVTVISIEVPKRGILRAEVFDLLGRRIITLVNKEYGPGKYRVDFDGSYFPSGIYFIRVNYRPIDKNSGTRSLVRKVLLVK